MADAMVERLRANLRSAGIEVDEADLNGMVEKGFLRSIQAAEEAVRTFSVELVPDYLKPWGDAAVARTSAPRESLAIPHIPPRPGFPSLVELAEHIYSREVSPVEVTRGVLERIAQRDPVLNAFQVVLADEALAAAREAEREIAAGNYRSPLHGVPLAVKDLYAMRGTITTAGSKILADWRTDFDAAVVERLKDAGAIIVGKTRMSEFAYSPGSNNAHYGPTRNPWNLEHDTGGSSSGSAAAVADGLVYGALGSDTGCSIRTPAALCGIVGIKPTFGRVSLFGGVTLSWSLDHAGPMTRTVADGAVMLSILAGYDPRDIRTRQVPVPDYAATLGEGVQGLRVGVLHDDGSGEPLGTPEVLAAWRAGVAALGVAGAELIEIDLPLLNELRSINSAVIAAEAAAFHQPLLQSRMQDYGEFPRQRLLSAYSHGPTGFVRAQQARAAIRGKLDQIFQQIDLLSTPSTLYGAPPLGDPSRNTWFMSPFNSLGWPAVTVPVGLTAEHLPIGLQVIGQPWDEATMLRAARVVEADGPWPGGTPES
ncbi:MAG TPA: amidase [Thermomicrobiaceae bacterium]|nr:amidase [Thermomicrobiaceae bacterium]